jgi:two-component system OmpR family response regulator
VRGVATLLQSRPVTTARRLKILIADDDKDGLIALSLLLESEGHAVVATEDGGAVLDLIARDKPDVVVMDVNMPPHSGYDIARSIRDQFGGKLTLICVTGTWAATGHQPSMMAGFNHFVTKPYKPETLIELISRVG